MSLALENKLISPIDTLSASQSTIDTSWATLQENSSPDKCNDHDEVIIPPKFLDLEFDAVFFEHKSTQTISVFYSTFGKIFKYLKLFFYHVLVLLFALPLIVLWAFISSFLMFFVTWVWSPVLKLSLLLIGIVLPLITEPLKALFVPCFDAAARIFSKIHVKASLNENLLSPVTELFKV